MPGQTWLKLFLKRNPDITERTVEKLTKVRAKVTERRIREWFEEVEDYLSKENVSDILKDPSRVFNMDETAFFLNPKSGKVLGIKEQRNVYEISSCSEKENITVLCNVNAQGSVPPTLIVYPGKRLPHAKKLDVPDDWCVGKSDSGWINGEVFFEYYFANYFFKWLGREKIVLPIIVFIDGHKSHLTYHLSKFCSENKIILVVLPPNCTHIMQPLDVAVFSPLKKGWVKAVHAWRMNNAGESLTKYNFAHMLRGF